MYINSKYFIECNRKTGTIHTNLISCSDQSYYPKDNPFYTDLSVILSICRKRNISNFEKNIRLTEAYHLSDISLLDSEINERLYDDVNTKISTEFKNKEITKTLSKATKMSIAKKLIDFFSEFNFAPSLRFVNTFVSVDDKKEYVANYFMLQDHPYSAEIKEKIASLEFDSICDIVNNYMPKDIINKRFKIYFGEPGTGKTTQALSETNNIIICASDMLPADLMQNFAFTDGKAEFQKSDLWLAMESGSKIILDEINMLPFETIRWLQGILDGKSTFNYKGFTIKIKDGFEVIGTMNLNVSGQVISIPAPLVDRCSNIVEFKLSPELLIQAI